MQFTRTALNKLGLPEGDLYSLPSSDRSFADGAHYRIEIPSVEGPNALEAVLEEADRRDVLIHRVSQGSGIMMLTDEEIERMVQLGNQAGIEVSLFVGPRAAWSTSAQILSSAGKNLGARLRGMDELVYATEDVKRACDLGIRSVLVADIGQIWLINELKQTGDLPADLVIKVSVQMGAANPISVRMIEAMGAGTYNVPTDLALPQIASIRATTTLPLDMYVEVPDNFGGFIRHYEVPELIRIASPIYIKLGVRNAPDIYPSGLHIEPVAIALARERIRRAELVQNIIRRYASDSRTSVAGTNDLGIPVLETSS